MRVDRHDLEGLISLHRIADTDERRATWRKGLADLASAVTNQRRTVPLEGLAPDQLRESMELARAVGLLGDVDWLSPEAAAAALYELAAALPACEAKRDIGRRVVGRLRTGDASTFVALATQLALGSSKRALSGIAIRARVALALDMPIGAGTRADALALALISRRDLSRDWLAVPATGSLPSRRLAARLLERAAREAARRAAEGDDSGIRVFRTPLVREASQRLLADRESLVWRHVATARGLLSFVMETEADTIQRGLASSFGVTEWRRSAASLAASIAVRPEIALDSCQSLLSSSVFKQDPGIAAAMLLGLPRAAENDPGFVEDFLEQLVRVGGLEAAEALVELRREQIGRDFAAWATRRAKSQLLDLLESVPSEDEGQIALVRSLVQELTSPDDTQRVPTLRDLTTGAIEAFATRGAAEAYHAAQQVMRATEARMGLLERCRMNEKSGRIKAFTALRELDIALLETDALANLLVLGARGDDPGELVRPLGEVFQRLMTWLRENEGQAVTEEVPATQVTLRLRRVRTMLHFVDADGSHVEDRAELLRERRLTMTRELFRRASTDIASPLHRALCAASARASDALVREEIGEVSDIVLVSGIHVPTAGDLRTMAEASMVPELKAVLHAYARLDEVVTTAPESMRGVRACIDGVLAVANELPAASSARVEAFRTSLLAYARALDAIASAGSLLEAAELARDTPLAPLELAAQTLAQLVLGARRRLGESDLPSPRVGQGLRALDLAFERRIRGGADMLDKAFEAAVEGLSGDLPDALARTAVLALHRLVSLPVDAPRRAHASLIPVGPKEAPLPAWVPPSRVLGGFFVQRAIGTGAGGTVFVARRAEERTEPHAEQFALKVPDYSGAAARTLSEAEFLQMFREEAGALLSLPQHENIARFVTFDAGAKPKPILVMELVEGPHLERTLEMGEITVERAFDLLDGVAAGLDAMHSVGVGHLDLKPSNIIVRDPDGLAGPDVPHVPVLVDFGLAGRKMRPGCGTAEYGAPEVWGLFGNGPHRAPPVDVYAFACVAYEVLTGRTLFEGPNEVALITQHVSHDGEPEGLHAMAHVPRLYALARALSTALRRDPAQRASIGEVRRALAQLRPSLADLPWPLALVP